MNHTHLFEQINSNIKHSFILQHHILSQLSNKSGKSVAQLYQYIHQIRSDLKQLKDNITDEWNPLQQQLITIVERVANLYIQKINHLEELLAEQTQKSKAKDIEINVLRNIMNQHYTGQAVMKDPEGRSSSAVSKDLQDKVKISEYITLSQSLAQESALPSARTVEVPNTHTYNIKKKDSVDQLNISLQLTQNVKESIYNSNFKSMVLVERNRNQRQETKNKVDSNQSLPKSRQNSRNSSSKTKQSHLNDSFMRVLRNKDIEWSDCKLQPLRRSFFQRRKSQRL